MKKFCVVLLLVLAAAPQMWGWGREGHRLVATIAESRLSPAAAAEIKALLGPESFVEIAPWADEYRSSHRETGPWHYVDIASTDTGYDRERDCPAAKDGGEWRDCTVDRIPYFVKQLKDKSKSPAERAFALKMIVHLVGDLHMPFHAIGDARGGNGIHVAFFNTTQCGERYVCNLHGVWDQQLIERKRESEKEYAADLEKAIGKNQWDKVTQGNPVVWANESHKLGSSFLVPDGAKLNQDYYDSAIVAVDRQLAVAGIRLARILNAALAE